MFTITPLAPGRFRVRIDGTDVTWVSYERTEAELAAILDRQREAWKRRIANVKLRRGEALKRQISKEYATRGGART